LDAVMDTLFDDAACTALAERAHQDALANHTYQQRVQDLLAHIKS
jgi:hypothetical protein